MNAKKSFIRHQYFSTHFPYVKGNSKEGKVHIALIFSKMPKPLVGFIIFCLSKNSFRFYAPSSSMLDAFFRGQ